MSRTRITPVEERRIGPNGASVTIIVPCYNEESNVRVLFEEVRAVFEGMNHDAFEVVFVNDGSVDGTQEQLEILAASDPRAAFIELSRNFGHQNALQAGLAGARGDAAITMDADLQHPPRVLPELIAKWRGGAEVVNTIRAEDKSLPWIKRTMSRLFYALSNHLSDVHVEPGAADFRLFDRGVVSALRRCGHGEPYLRGMTAWAGFRQVSIPYELDPRRSGTTKYTTAKMFALAFDGLTSFSVRPLYYAVYVGIGFAGFAVLFAPYVFESILKGQAVPGWASTLLAVSFFGGLNLGLLGVVGVYLGKLFIDNKRRPGHVIRSTNLPKTAFDPADF